MNPYISERVSILDCEFWIAIVIKEIRLQGKGEGETWSASGYACVRPDVFPFYHGSINSSSGCLMADSGYLMELCHRDLFSR